MQVFGLARLGRDAEVKYTPGGDAVATLALAFDYGKKGNDGKKPTQWVSGSLWGKRAEAMAPYLLKGQRVAVTLDDVHIRTWDKPEGGQGMALEGRISNIEFAGSPNNQGSQKAATPAPAPAPAASPPVNFDDFDDAPF